MKHSFLLSSHVGECVFLLPILLLGIATSHEDSRLSAIKNKWTFFGVIYPIFLYVSTWFLAFLKVTPANPLTTPLLQNIHLWTTNLLLSAIISCLLWSSKVWSGGDAKLFIAYAALIPITRYSIVYFKHFPSFTLLITVFVPATIFLFLKAMAFYFTEVFCLTEFKKKVLSLTQQYPAVPMMMNQAKIFYGFTLSYLLFFAIAQEIRQLPLQLSFDKNLHTLIFIAAYNRLSNFFLRANKIPFFILVFVIVYLWIPLPVALHRLRPPFTEALHALQKSFLLVIGMNAFNTMLNIYLVKTAKKTIPFAPWMFLGALIVWFF